MIYGVRDNYGTRRTAWTLRAAMAWLPYCGTTALIYNRWTRRVVVVRIQRRFSAIQP